MLLTWRPGRLQMQACDFSRFVSIFCCKAVPGVGGTVFAGILSDKELKGRGWGYGGEVNKLSAALSRSALVPVKDSTSSPNRSSSSSLELTVLLDLGLSLFDY